jgi:hypothetical protein
MPEQQQTQPEFMEEIFDSSTPDDKSVMDAQPPPETPPAETLTPEPPPVEAAPTEPVVETTPETQVESEATPVTEGLEHATKAEREKRQAAEKRAAELERRNAYLEGLAKGQQSNQQVKPQEELTAEQREELDRIYFDNPREWTEKKTREAAKQLIVEERMADSVGRMVSEVGQEYYDAAKRFSDYANQPGNQYLWVQLQQCRDPAREAYQFIKNMDNPPVAADPEAERAKIRAEERAKLEKELAGERVDGIPKSPVSAPGAGPGAAPVKAKGQTFDDLLEENEL